MKHKQANKTPKRDKAKKMLTKAERESNTPVYDSAEWQKRKDIIRKYMSDLGKKGGKARAEKLTDEELSAIAKHANSFRKVNLKNNGQNTTA